VRLAIMQPYFAPYLGYFQLLNAVDKFVIYDNIQFSKKGWIHRNRILSNGKDELISLTLKKDSDYLDIRDRTLSHDFSKSRSKLLRRIENSYAKAPYFSEVFPIVQRFLLFDDQNLFNFVSNSVKAIADYLSIQTEITRSSELDIDHSAKGENKVLKICKCLKAKTYINPPGGVDLYSKNAFDQAGLELKFLRPNLQVYDQHAPAFIPGLSIIDVAMFNSRESIANMLNDFTLFSP